LGGATTVDIPGCISATSDSPGAIGTQSDLSRLLTLAAAGRIERAVSAEYDFEEAHAAFEALADGTGVGKIVLRL
jgi:D-arabinose 1-dehydrogenase-like Zn-dependent alcohol dehydrogenase